MRFADNRNKIGKYIPAVVFLIFIYGMALWFIFSPKPDYSSSEKRYLQKFPEVTAEKLLSGDFGSEFETFFADRFPQRNTWVGLNAYTALAEGNNGASGVYNCKNGYLINKPVSTENNLDKNIGAVADFAKSIDTPTTVKGVTVWVQNLLKVDFANLFVINMYLLTAFVTVFRSFANLNFVN